MVLLAEPSADPTFPDAAADARCLGPSAQDSEVEDAPGPPGLCAVTLLVVVASMPLDLGAFCRQTVNISGAVALTVC